MDDSDLVAQAREVIDTTPYLVLGTLDGDGTPRTSPVFFGVDEYRDFYWVSSPEAIHSLNVAERPAVRAVIFDSTVRAGCGRAVYLTGRARRVPDQELGRRCEVAFRDLAGARAFAPAELDSSADLRLYLLPADVVEVHVPAGDPVRGTGRDRRVRIALGGAA